jgi:hypothetical protein
MDSNLLSESLNGFTIKLFNKIATAKSKKVVWELILDLEMIHTSIIPT